MTLEKAIEIQEHHNDNKFLCSLNEEKESRQLSIEAMKRERHCRQCVPDLDLQLLPGETKE